MAATATIALVVIGVAYGHYVSNQTSMNIHSPYTINTNTSNTNDGDFWSWFEGCLRFAPRQAYSYQYQPPTNSTAQPPTYVSPQHPCQSKNPNQGYYKYGFGRGC